MSANFNFENKKYINFNSRKKKKHFPKLLIILILILLFLAGLIFFFPKIRAYIENMHDVDYINEDKLNTHSSKKNDTKINNISSDKNNVDNIIKNAQRLALMYDYDKAIDILKPYDTTKQIVDLINDYKNKKSELVSKNILNVTHIFFHTLIYDTSKAFDGDSRSVGYNEVMTTIDEFNKILDELYKRGFVLVSLHDMASLITDENGNQVMKANSIMLPKDKTPIVMSQDDVNYYEYMKDDGFASRLIIDGDRVSAQIDMPDGSKKNGDYDLIPILDKFIDAHPDFSYHGSKAIIAVTGYNGVFGYRTDSSYEGKNPSIAADKKMVTEIANCLRNNGYELASHSWGHRHMNKISFEQFVSDTDKWDENVRPLIGDTDIFLFPFGDDIGDWHPYKADNQRFLYLEKKGFHYFCNVDSTQKAWVVLGPTYLRQGRRNLDGYRMWRDITEPDNKKLDDLFDANLIFDKHRSTPVGAIQ